MRPSGTPAAPTTSEPIMAVASGCHHENGQNAHMRIMVDAMSPRTPVRAAEVVGRLPPDWLAWISDLEMNHGSISKI